MNFNQSQTMSNNIISKNIIEKTGILTLIIGPMYSGKTSSILDLYRKYGFSKINTLVINYEEDKRYDESMMSTHDKIMIPCVNVLKIRDIMTKENLEQYDVFLINEGQFFGDLKECVMELVEKHNKTIYVCGLDGDFKRNGFEQIMLLIPLADEIIKKYAICKGCEDGTRALFSHRISTEQEVKVIGADNYIPLCRQCYLKYQQ